MCQLRVELEHGERGRMCQPRPAALVAIARGRSAEYLPSHLQTHVDSARLRSTRLALLDETLQRAIVHLLQLLAADERIEQQQLMRIVVDARGVRVLFQVPRSCFSESVRIALSK